VAKRQDEFERIAMPHSRSLLRVARRLASDAAAAEDLVQETLLLAWRGFHQFRAGTNARAWLFRILINESRTRARKLASSPAAGPLESDAPGRDSGVEDAIEISRALESLSLEHRTVLLLGIVEGFTCQEMAGILDAPIGTVMSRLSRARQALRARLEDESSRLLRTKGHAS
jgi:RNA polymerase sigma-70 factor, ECF subfamily